MISWRYSETLCNEIVVVRPDQLQPLHLRPCQPHIDFKFLFSEITLNLKTQINYIKKTLYCRGIKCSVSRLNQSNAQISFAFRHHWPELQ